VVNRPPASKASNSPMTVPHMLPLDNALVTAICFVREARQRTAQMCDVSLHTRRIEGTFTSMDHEPTVSQYIVIVTSSEYTRYCDTLLIVSLNLTIPVRVLHCQLLCHRYLLVLPLGESRRWETARVALRVALCTPHTRRGGATPPKRSGCGADPATRRPALADPRRQTRLAPSGV
jgi:hypothetical protein